MKTLVESLGTFEIVRGRFSPWKEQISFQDLPQKWKKFHDWAAPEEMFVIFHGEAIPMEGFQFRPSLLRSAKSARASAAGLSNNMFSSGLLIEMDRDCMVRVAHYFVRSK